MSKNKNKKLFPILVTTLVVGVAGVTAFQEPTEGPGGGGFAGFIQHLLGGERGFDTANPTSPAAGKIGLDLTTGDVNTIDVVQNPNGDMLERLEFIQENMPVDQDLTSVLTEGNDAGGEIISNLGTPVVSTDAATRQFVIDTVDAGGANGTSTFPGCGDYTVPTVYPDGVERYNVGVMEDNDCNKVDFDSTDSVFWSEDVSGETWYFTALPLVEEGKWGYTKDGKAFTRIGSIAAIQDYDTEDTDSGVSMDIKRNPYDNKVYMAVSKKNASNYNYIYVYYLDEADSSWKMFGTNYVYYHTTNFVTSPNLAFKSDGYVYCGFQWGSYPTSYWWTYRSNGGSWWWLISGNNLQIYPSSIVMDFDENDNLIILYSDPNSPYYFKSAKHDGSTLTKDTVVDSARTATTTHLLKDSTGKLTVVYSSDYNYILIKQYDSSTNSWSYTGPEYYSVIFDASGEYRTGNARLLEKYNYAAFDKNDVLWVAIPGRKVLGSKYQYKVWLREFTGTDLVHHDEYSMTSDVVYNTSLTRGLFGLLFNKNNDMIAFTNFNDDKPYLLNSYQYDKEHSQWRMLSSDSFAYVGQYLSNAKNDVFMTAEEETINFAFLKQEVTGENYKIETINSHSADSSSSCVALNGYHTGSTGNKMLSCPSGYQITSSTCNMESTNYGNCYIKSERELYLYGGIYSGTNYTAEGSISCCQ